MIRKGGKLRSKRRTGWRRKILGPPLRALSSLAAPLDAFFEKVMVNADEPEIRANRFALLAELRETVESGRGYFQIGGVMWHNFPATRIWDIIPHPLPPTPRIPQFPNPTETHES